LYVIGTAAIETPEFGTVELPPPLSSHTSPSTYGVPTVERDRGR